MFGHAVGLLRGHRQAALGAPPQDVVGAHRPFVAHQPFDLALGEMRAEILAEVLRADGVAQQFDRA